MLQIRREQMDVFVSAALDTFERTMRDHAKAFAPGHCAALGDEGVARVVRLGLERARTHGFSKRGPARLYIDLMLLLGSDFDTDPQYPWAAEILTDSGTSDQMRRAELLHRQTLDYVHDVAGPGNAYAKRALSRALGFTLEASSIGSEQMESALLLEMEESYPEKFRYVGTEALRKLMSRALELAAEHGLPSRRDARVFTARSFVLGHGFASDPQFPWVSSVLIPPQVADPDDRGRRLYVKLMAYLKAAVANPRE